MTIIEKGQWKDWEEVPTGFKKIFGKRETIYSRQGYFDAEKAGKPVGRFHTLKEALQALGLK
jgi:hypothetical protein